MTDKSSKPGKNAPRDYSGVSLNNTVIAATAIFQDAKNAVKKFADFPDIGIDADSAAFLESRFNKLLDILSVEPFLTEDAHKAATLIGNDIMPILTNAVRAERDDEVGLGTVLVCMVESTIKILLSVPFITDTEAATQKFVNETGINIPKLRGTAASRGRGKGRRHHLDPDALPENMPEPLKEMIRLMHDRGANISIVDVGDGVGRIDIDEKDGESESDDDDDTRGGRGK